MCNLCLCALQEWLIQACLLLPEMVDTVVDGSVAGTASQILTPEQGRGFTNHWAGQLLGVGNTVAAVGLAGILRAIMVVATSLQVILFMTTWFYARRSLISATLRERLSDGQRLADFWHYF